MIRQGIRKIPKIKYQHRTSAHATGISTNAKGIVIAFELSVILQIRLVAPLKEVGSSTIIFSLANLSLIAVLLR